MVRFTLYLIKTIIAFIATLLLISCNLSISEKKIESEGEVTTKEISVFNFIEQLTQRELIEPKGQVITKKVIVNENFTKIDVSAGLDVFLTQEKEQKITIEAQKNLIEHISIYAENETLIIKKNKNFKGNSTKNIYVSMPKIEKIKASSGSSITSQNTIKSRELNIDASSAANIQANIVASNLEIESSSGAQLLIDGKVVDLEIDSSSGSFINASNATCKNIEASASSGSTIKINAINSLNAKASSGASILYSNTPTVLTLKQSSGGNIKAI